MLIIVEPLPARISCLMKNVPNPSNVDLSAAYHEAGYAVVARYFQVPVNWALIRPGCGSGEINTEGPSPDLPPMARIMIGLAGRASQKIMGFEAPSTADTEEDDGLVTSYINDLPEEDQRDGTLAAFDPDAEDLISSKGLLLPIEALA